MNQPIPIKNDTASPMFVGSAMIPPGETRVFELAELPPEYRPSAKPAAEVATDDPLLALVALSVAKLALGLPDLSDDELLRLEALEKAKEKPRAGALAEITAERLRRAEATTPGGLVDSTDDDAGNNTGSETSGD